MSVHFIKSHLYFVSESDQPLLFQHCQSAETESHWVEDLIWFHQSRVRDVEWITGLDLYQGSTRPVPELLRVKTRPTAAIQRKPWMNWYLWHLLYSKTPKNVTFLFIWKKKRKVNKQACADDVCQAVDVCKNIFLNWPAQLNKGYINE